MKTLRVCPSCGVRLRVDGAETSPVKCGKCHYCAPVSEFPEVTLRTLYCPACGKSLKVPDDDSVKVIKCPHCKSSHTRNLFTDSPCQDTLDDGKTTLSCAYKKDYRNAGLRLHEDIDGRWNQGANAFVTLKKGINVLGRQSASSSATVQLPTSDSFMSRNHAIIEVNDRGCLLSDNSSMNGTWLNGVRIGTSDVALLMPGDTVRLGHTVFVFEV